MRRKKKTLFGPTVLVLLAAAISSPATNGREPQSTRVSVRHHADYQQVLTALHVLVKEKAKNRKNTFYIANLEVKKEAGDDLYYADVYWKEGKSIILLGSHPSDWEHALVWSRRFWHLDRDVVRTVADVGGSSYLLTRADARRIIAHCLRGDRFVIYKKSVKSGGAIL